MDSVKPHGSPTDTNADTILIVKKFCGNSCHLLPDPSLLDKKTWTDKVLPNMGCRLGIQTEGYNPYGLYGMEEVGELVKNNVYPDLPLVSVKDWTKIMAYFKAYSPDSIPVPEIECKVLDQFRVIPFGEKVESPRITLLSYDSSDNRLNVGMESGLIYSFNGSMDLVDTVSVGQTPMDMLYYNGDKLVLTLGNMYPSEMHTGRVMIINKDKIKSVLLEKLHRPVHFDFYNERSGRNIAISEFGYETGSLSMYSFDKGLLLRQADLSMQAGSVKTIVMDVDGDSINDVVSLMAQGDERVIIFKKDKKDHFKPITVLRFPPVHGVCDIDMVDMNADSRPDLIISNGDNADYSIMTKPYHGIGIYINKGELNFVPDVFVPYPNILHSEIADFDQDGDQDIAATAFFSHSIKIRYPAFIYFEQAGGKFVPYTFPQSNYGKWMTIKKADMDMDGDEDIFMGSFLLNNYLVEGSREDLKKYSLLVMKNIKK